MTPDATIRQARALWTAVDRPNLYVKIPVTTAGLEVTATLIGKGIT